MTSSPERLIAARPIGSAGALVSTGSFTQYRLALGAAVLRRNALLRRGGDPNQDGTDIERLPFCAAEFDDPAGVRTRYLDLRLVGLHRAQRLVQLDIVANRDTPTRDSRIL